MPDCECLASCPFFNDVLKSTPAMQEIYKEKYCRGDNAMCARFMISKKLGRDRVPAELFPNQVDRAWKVFADSSLPPH